MLYFYLGTGDVFCTYLIFFQPVSAFLLHVSIDYVYFGFFTKYLSATTFLCDDSGSASLWPRVSFCVWFSSIFWKAKVLFFFLLPVHSFIFFSPLFSLFTNRSVTYSYFSLLFYFALSFSLSFSNNSSSFVILAIYLRWLSAPDKGFFFNRTIWNYLQSIITDCKVLINNKIIKSSVYLTAFKSAHVSGPTQWFMTT